MKTQTLNITKLETGRLILIPFTIQICQDILNEDYSRLLSLGLCKGKSWPDNDVLETLPRIINNLSRVEAPTGFESWMIIKKETSEIIGDLGFKGFNAEHENIDIGYGIIQEERRNGYSEEATRVLINWAFSSDVIREITASCLINNISSINLLTKLNFKETKSDGEMIYWTFSRLDPASL